MTEDTTLTRDNIEGSRRGTTMQVNRRLIILATLILVVTMAIATQYAVTKVSYFYTLVHPCDASIRFIGSDNSSDDIRVLRVAGSNSSNVSLTLRLGGKLSSNMKKSYSAAFGIVNEEPYPLNITHINVSSLNATYMKIYLHGDRTANAESNLSDPSTVFMYNNGTIINTSNTTAWILAAGDDNTSNMCYNVSNRVNCSIPTPWDETAHVRYSLNNTNAVSNVSDFVWVQITLDIPPVVDAAGQHTGTIWVHYEYEL